jgi:hypothetical protein
VPGAIFVLKSDDELNWHNFHVWREWPAEMAIDMGQPLALRELLPVITDLARIYLDVIATVHPG